MDALNRCTSGFEKCSAIPAALQDELGAELRSLSADSGCAVLPLIGMLGATIRILTTGEGR
jgi:hypothetical protein